MFQNDGEFVTITAEIKIDDIINAKNAIKKATE